MDITSIESFFTKQEVEYLLGFTGEFHTSGIRIRGEDTFTDYRVSEDYTSTDSELNSFLLNKLAPFNIISIPNVGYIRYVEGSKFKPHRDRDDVKGVFTFRYRTFLIQLSESSDYEGGNLIVEDRLMPRSIGSVIMFNSKYLHEVTEVTQGTRYSLCLFLKQSDFRSSIL